MAAPRAYKVTREVVHLLAGKMNREGRTVTPDDRRGMLRLVECDDGCMRVEFVLRSDGNDVDSTAPEESFVADKGDKLEPVPQCTTGRVYVLRVKDQRHLYWMQAEDDTDEPRLVVKFNKALDRAQSEPDQDTVMEDAAPPPPTSAPFPSRSTSSSAQQAASGVIDRVVAEPDGFRPTEEQFAQAAAFWILAHQLEEAGVRARPRVVVETRTTAVEAIVTGGVLLSKIHPTPLRNVLPREVLMKLAEDPEGSKELQEQIPKGHNLEDTITSAQLQQAMARMDEAIYSENVLALFQALELDAAVLDTNPDPFECLCEALERKYKKEGSSEPSAGDDDAQKGEDEDMHSAD